MSLDFTWLREQARLVSLRNWAAQATARNLAAYRQQAAVPAVLPTQQQQQQLQQTNAEIIAGSANPNHMSLADILAVQAPDLPPAPPQRNFSGRQNFLIGSTREEVLAGNNDNIPAGSPVAVSNVGYQGHLKVLNALVGPNASRRQIQRCETCMTEKYVHARGRGYWPPNYQECAGCASEGFA